MSKAKVRGLKRKIRNLIAQMEEVAQETQVFPAPHHGDDYWHLHFPSQQHFIDSQAMPFAVRRLCVQKFIEQAYQLVLIASSTDKTRVVVAITLPNIVQSQIIIFFGENYFRDFFERNTDAQRWTLAKNKRLSRGWDLTLPLAFSERIYHEERQNEDGIYKGQIWFIGQID